MIKFGVAGNSLSFFAEGHSTSCESAAWCKGRNIDVFEYSFGRGITLPELTARAIGESFKNNSVELTVHAPYFINFSNTDPDMIEKSIQYVLNSIKKVREFGGNRVVVHPASLGKQKREAAQSLAVDNFRKLKDRLEENNLLDTIICIETMGKKGQLGTVDEVIELTNVSDNFYPCCDFGHINSREGGILKTALNYNTIMQKMLDNMPKYKVFNMHIHFSKIMYGAKGELKHLTFEDTIYGPDYQPMLETVASLGLSPYIICESDGTQAEDAITMKNYYNSLL